VKSRIRKFSIFVLLSLIRAYQVMVSPLLVPACRFQPSCSQYMLEAVDLHGPLRGGIMGLRRLLRCHPFRKGGYDPVPQ
jgi:putative membrane protein insertion efficiency factor